MDNLTDTPQAKLSLWKRLELLVARPNIPIENAEEPKLTAVDRYWGQHTVRSSPFRNARKSLSYLEWRFSQYPLFRELMDLWGQHDEQTVVDYGCGPGNDLVGFLIYTRASKVIGIDVSEKALRLARRRLQLHRVSPQRIRLIKVSDNDTNIPLEDQSVDYIYSEGVLHHTSNPQAILKEFYRILKQDKYICIMVYNRNSVFVNLHIAYKVMVLQRHYPGLSLEQVFSRSTDGVDCPISRYYNPDDFITMCETAGFDAEFAGGYLSTFELELFKKLGVQAIFDERLPEQHRLFLRSLIFTENGCPTYQGKYAGIGGVYRLHKK